MLSFSERQRLRRLRDRATRDKLDLRSSDVWLLDELAEGARPADELLAKAKAAGWTGDALRRAATRLRVEGRREGLWRLPEEEGDR